VGLGQSAQVGGSLRLSQLVVAGSREGYSARSVGLEAFEALLGDTLNSRDALWHNFLYTWLSLQEDLKGYLKRIDSPFIERWLETHESMLKGDFHAARGEYGKAALHWRELAEEETCEIEKRRERLENAIKYARMGQQLSASGVRGGGAAVGDIAIPQAQISEWDAELRYLRAQEYFLRVLKEAFPRAAGEVRDLIERCEYSVLEAPELFESANKHKLNKAVIKILGAFGSPFLPLIDLPIGATPSFLSP